MRAVIYEKYGPPGVLRVADIDKPVPGDDEILVEVRATTVNRTDCGFRSGTPLITRLFGGLLRPRKSKRVLGSEFAGEVEAIGSKVTDFAVGDHVFGVNADRFGAHAEYLRVKQSAPVAIKPTNLSFEEAAATPDGVVLALTVLRWTKLEKGQRVLVYGASGSIGTATVQLALHLGADVTAVCNTENVDVVRSLGPDRVIDYTQEDFTAQRGYHVVVDAVGKLSFRTCRPLLQRGGIYASTDGGHLWQNAWLMPLMWPAGRFGVRRVMLPLPRYTQKDVLFLKGLLESGVYRPVVDRAYQLDEVVEATEYVETEQKTGNVVLTVTG